MANPLRQQTIEALSKEKGVDPEAMITRFRTPSRPRPASVTRTSKYARPVNTKRDRWSSWL